MGARKEGNAYRHVIWQAMLTVALGSRSAAAWGNAHEGDDRSRDHSVDVWNNVAGRMIGRSIRVWQYPAAKQLRNTTEGELADAMGRLGHHRW
ncbi:DUF6973 domain-containing protein [Kibdelosporangium banguiense]|uniref:DUF6973 domain-containing protein n=1 Tax=Kibdelosporangium banguiense TaxID=1365924 RepID=UPI0035577D86